MESSSDRKIHKDSASFLKNFLEIKRPVKQKNTTLPKLISNMEKDNDKTNKDRLFVRHQSYRRTTRKNKYKKDTAKTFTQKHSDEAEYSVKSLCQQFEDSHVAIQNSSLSSCATRREVSSSDKIIINTEMLLSSPRDANKNVEVIKRTRDNNKNQKIHTKTKSFVEAENEEETEKLRQSFILEMDLEMAKMKEDGFIDYTGTIDISTSSENSINNDGIDAYLVHRVLDCNDEQRNIVQRHGHTNDCDTIIYENKIKSDCQIDFECEEAINKEAREFEKFISKTEEFNESFSDEIENDMVIVEAYNDDGKELIEVQVTIERKVVTIGKQSLQDVLKHSKNSDMIFFKEDGHTFNLMKNNIEPNVDDNIIHKNEDLCILPSTSTKNGVYEYIEIPNKDNHELPFLMFAPLSNRSTIYSTTSQESSVFDEDDEGISLGRNKDNQEELYSNVRRETFCDNKGIVRIERVGVPDNSLFLKGNNSAPVSRSNSTTSCKKLECIVEEILSTEKKYVEDLAKVVKLYKPFIERHVPPHLEHYQGYLFGNLEKIYRRQRKFLQAMEKSDSNVDQIIHCFLDHEFLFEMYPHYFRNKPRADNLLKEFNPIIKEMQETFEERLDFSAYLLTPVQRLGRYILFLENIEKQLKKLNLPVEGAQSAIAILKDEMSKGNDSVAIESIENSPISKMDYGSFKMREKFSINKPRKVDAMVFLFSHVVVFTTCDTTKLETFYYYDSIKMNDLRIATFDDLTIHLTDFTKSKKKQNSSKYTYVLETKTEKVWKTWTEAIEKMLWDQLVKVKENSISQYTPRKQKNVEKARTRSVGGSVFYCN
ncbi:uncharacterized protein LOC130443013 isoform X2 [Diorhabda sublineata]|uniref:uncharacterized protein LOC130443013 isoform X2 n=1 Tax=Diorhabda sublineata TaxID=1163346 RepID=UPI0024E0863F|nr:uncharacterized protein LOC130443013 isoform X2 [Diorhabda sublineata]